MAAVRKIFTMNHEKKPMLEGHFDTVQEAYHEALRIRNEGSETHVSVERSPYGGYRLRTISPELMIDFSEYFGSYTRREYL